MLIRLLAFLSMASAIMLPATNSIKPEKLVKAEFNSHTNDENKDFDSGVSVEVRNSDQSILLAEIKGADATKEYKDDSDNKIDLVVKSEGSSMKDCEKYVFRVGMKPNGNDCWRFKGTVTLYFDNGKTLIQEIGNSEIKSKNELKWTAFVGGK